MPYLIIISGPTVEHFSHAINDIYMYGALLVYLTFGLKSYVKYCWSFQGSPLDCRSSINYATPGMDARLYSY